MKRTALTTMMTTTGALIFALSLSGCVTIVLPESAAPSNDAPSSVAPQQGEQDEKVPVPEDLDNRTDVSCAPGEELLLNDPSTLYSISGPCERLTVEGNGLIVRAEHIDILVLRGGNLLIEADSIGSVEINGQENTVRAGAIDSLKISGERNTVSSTDPIDKTDVSGNDNDVS